jgi:type II secretory pathway pseudopilin PulG
MKPQRTEAFTLIETVAALAIASIALLGLLQLHLISIRMADKAQATTRAVFLAQEKMAEVLSAGFPQVGTRSGTVEIDNTRFTWRTEVADARLQPVERKAGTASSRMRKLSVEVACGADPRERQVRLITYMAENRIREL